VTNSNIYNSIVCIILIGGSYTVFLSYLFWHNFQLFSKSAGLSEHVYAVCIISNDFPKSVLNLIWYSAW